MKPKPDKDMSSTNIKLDQLLQQVVAESTQEAKDARQKKKRGKSQDRENMLESLRKGGGIESLHKEKDSIVLANTFDPDSGVKGGKSNKERQRQNNRNTNANNEDDKQNVDHNELHQQPQETKKKKARKKKEDAAIIQEEHEMKVIQRNPLGEVLEKPPRPSPRKIKSPEPRDGLIQSEATDTNNITPTATPRKKKTKTQDGEGKIDTDRTPDTNMDEYADLVTGKARRKKKIDKSEPIESEKETILDNQEAGDSFTVKPKEKKKKKVQKDEELMVKDDRAQHWTVDSSKQEKAKTRRKIQSEDESLVQEDEDRVATEAEPQQRNVKKKKKIVKENQPEAEDGQQLPEQHLDATTEKTTPRRKQKKKNTAGENTGMSEVAESEQTPREIEDLGEVLALIIHRTDKLKTDFHILHPVIRVHLVSEETGEYIQKQHLDRAVTSYFETSNEAVKTILPMMTQPFDFKERKSTIPVWEELLVFNENYNYLIQPEPKVILLFELLDFVSMNKAGQGASSSKEDGGWHKIAWAFLKLLGKNGKVNTGNKLRLQLFLPPSRTQSQIAGQPQVFTWWQSGQRNPYPSTLYVTLKNMVPPEEVSGAMRSMFATQKELGQMSYQDLKSLNWSGKDKTLTKGRTPTTWTRLAGQLCRIPNTLNLTLKTGKKGCYVVKFSNDGRSLACACQDGTDHPILVFEIPSGALKGACRGHFGLVYSLCWNRSDTQLLSASSDGTARVWDTDKLEETQVRLLPHPGFVYTAEFHPRVDSIIASGCYDEVVRVWDISVPEGQNVLQQEIEEHHGHVNSICFDVDEGQKMYTADSVGTILIWNCFVSDDPTRRRFLRDWTKYQEIKDPELKDFPINCIRMHPSGRRLLVHGRNNAIFMFDLRVQRVMQKYFGAENLKEKICSSISPCGSFVFSGSEDGKVYAWSTDTGDQVAVYSQLNYLQPVTDVHYHPRDHMLAICSLGDNLPVYIYKYDPLIAQAEAASPRPMSPLETTDVEEMATARSSILAETVGTKVMTKEEFDLLEKVRYQRVLKKLETATLQMSQMPGMVDPEAAYSPRMEMSYGRSPRSLMYDSQYMASPRTSNLLSGRQSPHGSLSYGVQGSTQRSSFRTYSMGGDGSRAPGFSEMARGRSQSPTYYGRPPHLSLNTSLGKAQFTFESPVGDKSGRKQVMVMYDYRAQRSDELSLVRGDVITLLYKDNDQWWMGELPDGQQGFFPSNYVFEHEENQNQNRSRKSSLGDSSSGTLTAVKTKSGELKFLSGGEESDVEAPVRQRKKKQVTYSLNGTGSNLSSLPPPGPIKQLNNSIEALLGEYESVA